MFKFNNLRLGRKLSILVVLIIGLFFALADNSTKAGATFCCSVCDDPHMECIADCNAAYPNNPSARWSCIQQECNPPWFDCMEHNPVCDPGC